MALGKATIFTVSVWAIRKHEEMAVGLAKTIFALYSLICVWNSYQLSVNL